MESVVIRSLLVYLFVFLILRFSGKRTLGEMTTFDFVLLLIISEACQQALVDDDHSLTGAFLSITTLVFVDIMISLASSKWKKVDKVINGVPLIILMDGKLLKERMEKARIDESDIMEAARKLRGIDSIDKIKYAVLEKDGQISIIPNEEFQKSN